MDSRWLAIQSFRRNQDLITAINVLSIHTKLKLSGQLDEERSEDVAQAKVVLKAFLNDLGKVVEQIELAEDAPLLGIDPRLRQLAGSFARARREGHRFHSSLFSGPVSHLMDLLASSDAPDQQALVESLAELRILVEEHTQTDTARILEDF